MNPDGGQRYPTARDKVQPVVVDVMADATDEELDELAMIVVARLDAQAAEHHRESSEADH